MEALGSSGEDLQGEDGFISQTQDVHEEDKTDLQSFAETPNPPEVRPNHVSFMLDENKLDARLSTSPEELLYDSCGRATAEGTTSQDTLVLDQRALDERESSFQQLEHNEGDNSPGIQNEEASGLQQNLDTAPLGGLQHARGLSEAMTLLSTTAQELEGRVNVLLSQHEEEFFSAFRAHMTKVQKHVQYLQECADEQKNLLERDLKIRTLQQELEWFVKEAVRLDQVSA